MTLSEQLKIEEENKIKSVESSSDYEEDNIRFAKLFVYNLEELRIIAQS